MLIVHLTASRFFGGPERQILELARTLAPDVQSVFLSFSEEGLCRAFLDEVRRDGFEGYALRHDTPRLLGAIRELTERLPCLGADLLCCHGYKANLLGLLGARRAGIPVISVSRGWTAESWRVRLYEALDRRVLHHMDKVVCVSAGQRAKVLRAGVAAAKTMVIHNAIRVGRFSEQDEGGRAALEALFPSPPTLLVGAAGRLSPEKGFELLVDAAAEVARSGLGAGFVLFGEGPRRGALARQIEIRGLEGSFILGGFRADLDRLMAYFDLFVLPSFTEGLPNVVLEAFAAGVPVVATAVGGTPEVIEDRLNGFLVPPGNAAALARPLRELLLDATLRARMGLRGRERVLRKFSFDAQADSYRRLFEELAGKRSKEPVGELGLVPRVDHANLENSPARLSRHA